MVLEFHEARRQSKGHLLRVGEKGELVQIDIPDIPSLEEVCWNCRKPRNAWEDGMDFDDWKYRGAGCEVCDGKGSWPTSFGLAVIALVQHHGGSK